MNQKRKGARLAARVCLCFLGIFWLTGCGWEKEQAAEGAVSVYYINKA